jgi:hypothetical protein
MPDALNTAFGVTHFYSVALEMLMEAWDTLYNYVSPAIDFYRLLIVVVFFIWSLIFGIFAFQTGTQSEVQFLPDDHRLQHVYTLSLNKFSTALNDFSFGYLWGIDPTPVVTFTDHLTIDNYDTATFTPPDISNESFKSHIMETWDLINVQPFIDPNAI